MLAARATHLIVTFWIGSLWTIGYLVAPTLFATLADSAMAGSIAGKLFRIEAWVTVVLSLILVALFRLPAVVGDSRKRKQLTRLVLAMLACTLIGYFALHPFMAELRAAAGTAGAMNAEARARFGMLHGISSAFYLVQSLLGVALVLRLR